MQMSKRTILKEGKAKHHGAPIQLVHKTAGYEIAGSGTRETSEAWGVLFPEARSGQWYKLQSVAEKDFDAKSA